jgi:manganese transport protein
VRGAKAPPPQQFVLPPPTSFGGRLLHLGPGFIITATIVGSGELIVTPKLGASVGFTLLWFIVLGCALKVFVQIELARTAIATNQSTLAALDTLPGPRWRVSWVLWLWLLMYVALVFQVGGIIGGIAAVFAELGLGGSARAWALPVGLSCAALLASGRYGPVEKGCTIMVGGFVISAVISVVALQWTPYHVTLSQIASGWRFTMPPGFGVAFAAFGVIGVGASELIYYPYWCLEKGYARHVGPADGSAAWAERARGWMGVMRTDAAMSLVLYTSITVAFYLLGAAILHARGLDVTNVDLVHVLSQMFRQTFGEWATLVFLAGAFFVLYSTLFGATAANALLMADALTVFRLVRYTDGNARRRVIRDASIGLSLASTMMFLLWSQPVTLVLIGATAQALMLPFLGFAAVRFQRARGAMAGVEVSRLEQAGLLLSATAMMLLGAYQFWDLIF